MVSLLSQPVEKKGSYNESFGVGFGIWTEERASQISLDFLFPIALINSTTSISQSSQIIDLILEMCVPRFLCAPEHWMQMKIPKLTEAHSGSEDN